jgi:deoxyadenosine/deoxycytidine kinase
LSEGYNRFFFTYSDTPLLTVNVTDIDFVKNKSDYENLVKAIVAAPAQARRKEPTSRSANKRH